MLVDFEEWPSVLKVEKHVDANATPVWDPMSMQSLHEQGSGRPRHLAVEWEATASLCTKVLVLVLVPGYRPTRSCRGQAWPCPLRLVEARKTHARAGRLFLWEVGKKL